MDETVDRVEVPRTPRADEARDEAAEAPAGVVARRDAAGRDAGAGADAGAGSDGSGSMVW